MPALNHVRATLAALHEHRLVAALGGSGLLAALGLTQRVHDWDLSSDAEPRAVEDALCASGIQYTALSTGDGVFATRSRYRVDGGDHDVELLVGFAVRAGASTVALPTRVTGTWRGLPLADPAVWARAYELMGRPESAALLRTWLDSPS
jgi:hypothetical protein